MAEQQCGIREPPHLHGVFTAAADSDLPLQRYDRQSSSARDRAGLIGLRSRDLPAGQELLPANCVLCDFVCGLFDFDSIGGRAGHQHGEEYHSQ